MTAPNIFIPRGFRRIERDCKGAALPEYLVLVGAIAVASILSVSFLGEGIAAVYHDIRNRLETPGATLFQPSPDFSFEPSFIPWQSGQTRITSNYVTIPRLRDDPAPFRVSTSTGGGNAVASSHVVGGGEAASGELTWGTQMVADVPDRGETLRVTLHVNGMEGDWLITRGPLPLVEDFDFGTTHLSWSDVRSRIRSAYLDIEGLEFVPRDFVLASTAGGTPVVRANVVGDAPATSGQVHSGTQLEVDLPPPGERNTLYLTIGEGRGSWTLIREAKPPIIISPFSFPDTVLPWSTGQTRVVSDYISIPGLDSHRLPFEIEAPDGGAPRAESNVSGGQPADIGEMTEGTSLSVEIPDYGQTRIVRLLIGGQVAEWRVSREPLPAVQPFDFGTTHLAWNETRHRVKSGYLNIDGVGFVPRAFSLTGPGAPRAIANVVGDLSATEGRIVDGTQLEIDVPAPGERHVATLTVDGTTGTWTVDRDPEPDAGPFHLTNTNGQNFAQISFDGAGVPRKPYTFSISGTGNTRPYLSGSSVSSGSGTSGMTASWGINIHNATPPSGQSETITLMIDGKMLQWRVTGP